LTNVDLTVTEKSEIANTSVTKFTLIATVSTVRKEEPPLQQKEDGLARGIRAIREGRPASP
jgi:hypothetical protein